MNISENGLDFIKKHEGCRFMAYYDSVGIPTIGYGHTANVKIGDSCTQEQADLWLHADCQIFVGFLNQQNEIHKLQLNQNEFDALLSFIYNEGQGHFLGSTLFSLLKKKDFTGAAEQFSHWVYAGGKVLQGLVNRREAEKQLFLLK